MFRHEANAADARAHRASPFAPVFIVGCPRSGTTLLQRMLDAHPRVAIAPETHFIRRFWLQRDRHGDLADDDSFQSVIDELLSTPEVGDMRLDEAAFKAAASEIDRNLGALFALLLQSYAASQGADVAGEKTPNHLLYMPTLQEFFPAARFVHVVRDPRAVVHSWRSVPWSTGSVSGDARVWRRYIRMAWRQGPGRRCHLVRYEALVAEPEDVLRGVCRFLGLEFDTAMLAYHERRAGTLDLEREPWKSGVARPVHKASVAEWREKLSVQEVIEIEQIAGVEMVRFGYRPVHVQPSWLKVSRQALRAATRTWPSR